MKKITVVSLALCSFLFGGDLFSVKAQILEKFTLAYSMDGGGVEG